jgi:hypothetical protein
MDDMLRRALAPVLSDLARGGVPAPRVEEIASDDPRWPSIMLWSVDGSGVGLRVDRLAAEFEQVVDVAEGVQEWAIEELWGQGPTNWPACPRHPVNHPLQANVQNYTAMWTCPVDMTPISPIGDLG